MAVNWQSIEIPFGGGINTKTNPRRLQPPQLEDIQNLVFTDAPGYKSRYGSSVLNKTTSLGGTLTVCEQLATAQDELLLFDDGKLYTRNTVESEWKVRETLHLPKTEQEYKFNTTQDQRIPTTAELSSVRVTAFNLVTTTSTLTTFKLYVEDIVSGAVFNVDTTYSGFNPKAIASSSHIYVFYLNGTNLSYEKIDPAAPDTAPTNADVRTNVTTTAADKIFAIAKDPSDDDVFIVTFRRRASSIEGVATFRFDASTDTAGSDTVITTAPYATAEHLTCVANQSFAFVGGSESSGRAFIYRMNVGDLSGLTSVDTTTTAGSAPDDVAMSTDPSGTSNTPDFFLYEETSVGDGTVYVVPNGDFSSETSRPNNSIASEGFFASGVNHVLLMRKRDSGLTNTYILTDLDSFEPEARFFPQIGYDESSYGKPNVYQDSNNKWVIPVVTNQLVTTEVASFGGKRVALLYVDFDATDRYQSVEFGDTTFVVGGNSLWEYDGRFLTTNNFWVFPDMQDSDAADTTGGSLTTSSTYNYRVYYEYYDAKNNRARSTVSGVATVTTSATNNAVTLTIPTITKNQHNEASNILITVFRSEADADIASGAPLYRVSSLDPSTAGSANGFLLNDPSNPTVSFTDNLSDANLITKELDYLNTGELDNVPPPDCEYIASAKGRLWVVGGANKNVVYFSKLKFTGDAVAFNEANSVVLPYDSNPKGVTAIAELNHFVVFFKSESIYVVSGDGPDNLGRGFFNEPQRVTSDVGCSEPRSVVAYDGGLLFKSDKGIYRLGQNLQVDYIGAPVETYNSQDITAATLVNDQNQIRFLTSSGRMLVYDYLVNQWTTFTGWTGISAVNWRNGDVYCWAESDGTVHQEDSSTFEDNGTPVDSSFTTAPITLQGLGGFYRMQRLIFIGDYSTLTRFEVTPYYDGNTTGTEAGVLTSALDDNDPFRVIFNMPRQKFSDVKFKITMDKSNSGTSEGVTLQAMRAKVAYKPGLDKLSDGNKFGS